MNTAVISGPVEFLAFSMGLEEYGLDITNVQEIRQYESITPIANAPKYFKGVINLRGVIVPIIDMRVKLNIGEPTYDALTIVIVLNIYGHTIGMVVDNVSDVVTILPEQIRPAPQLSGSLDLEYLIGIGTVEKRMLILINIGKLMQRDDIGLVTKSAA